MKKFILIAFALLSVALLAGQENERDIQFNLGAAAPAAETYMPGVSPWPVVRVLLAMVVIAGALYAFSVFIKKSRILPEGDNPFLRRPASLNLGLGKSVQVVTLGDQAYLVGVTDHAVSLIGAIDDKELVSRMNLYAEENRASGKPLGFASLLGIFTGRKRETGIAFTTRQGENFVRQQRERLSRAGETT
ncbi:MAG: flagellar biosynthetic protein FliO [Spirochaetaceae bacterium]|jgi:flagellar protein FliO/FliZ|nr:flagellar biosynthetic protein FliO [Spirochaetaceae bacterium]